MEPETQRSGNESIAAWTRRSLGFVLLRQHREHEARAYFVEALRIYQKYLKIAKGRETTLKEAITYALDITIST